jgi:hypothetical protein
MEVFYIEVVKVLHETPGAILIKVDQSETELLERLEEASETGQDYDEQWIPKSQIHEDSEVTSKDDSGTLAVKWWFAREREFCDG